MSISDRLYNLAKSYLDAARTRWDDVDPAARKELDDAVNSPASTAWERAQKKINNVAATNAASKELQSSTRPGEQQFAPAQPNASSPLPPVSENALSAAYKVLNLPDGSSLSTVQTAHQDLIKKTDPSKFPEGSKDRTVAEHLYRRINAAYMMLANALSNATDDRFDRLEL
jgi:hypothetical protein